MSRRIIIKQYNREGISNCSDCSFRNKNRVWGEGNLNGICLIGEAPGKDENLKRRPFVGKAGKILDKGLEQAGIKRYSNWVTNVICGQPSNNNYADILIIKAVQCCEKGFRSEIKFLIDSGIKVLIPLGRNACTAVGLSFKRVCEVVGTPIKDTYFNQGDLYILPNYHPSYILRKGGVSYTGWGCWVDNFKSAKELITRLRNV